jgi:hypothetical protein
MDRAWLGENRQQAFQCQIAGLILTRLCESGDRMGVWFLVLAACVVGALLLLAFCR